MLMFLVWGAQSNLLAAATSTLGYIVQEPRLYHDLATRMRKAVKENFADTDGLLACEPNALNAPAFSVLESVIYETLRHDAVPSIIREVKEDIDLRGDGISPGHPINLSVIFDTLG